MSGPAFAAEPDGPATLITSIEAVRIILEHHLSLMVGVRKSEQAALAEYYSVPDGPLVWVNENGLNDRAKAVMDEIAKADEYGLRAGDYKLPKSRWL